MTTTDEHGRLAALRAWRDDVAQSGVDDGQLPTEKDLRRIAQVKEPSRAVLERLPFDRRSAVLRYMPGILNQLRATGGGDASASERRAGPPDDAVTGPVDDAPGAAHRSAPPPAPAPAAAPVPDGPFATAPMASEGSAPAPVGRVTARADGLGVDVTWQDGLRDAVVLYRLVVHDEYPPYSPEAGRQAAVSRTRSARDDVALSRAVRHVSVWAHAGDDEAGAREAPPQLVGRALAVGQVRDADVRGDHGQVTGRWTTPPGVARVDVVRVPAADAGPPEYLPDHVLDHGDDGLYGFTDRSCRPGVEYEYRLFAVVSQQAVETLSLPVVHRVTVAATLEPVVDLQAVDRVEQDGTTVVDLLLTPPPVGSVVVYRTTQSARAGAEDDLTLVESSLEGAGLPPATRLGQGQQPQPDGRVLLRGVPWPPGADRVHFTPVSLLEGRARIGREATVQRASAVEDVRLVERVDWQLLTFDWPSGAAVVDVHLTAPDVPLDLSASTPKAQLDASTYQAQGGLRLHGVLPAGGCDLHLVPATYYDGGTSYGQPKTVSYPGLLRLEYRLYGDGGALKGGLMRALRRRSLEVLSSATLRSCPPLVLVHNADRLPLDLRDGEGLLRVQGPVTAGEWVVLKEDLPVGKAHRGWLRLFVDWDGDVPTIALVDPPVGTLRG